MIYVLKYLTDTNIRIIFKYKNVITLKVVNTKFKNCSKLIQIKLGVIKIKCVNLYRWRFTSNFYHFI